MSDKPKVKRRGRGEGCISKRKDGRWSATLDMGVDASGKRKRKTVYGKTRKEAHTKLQEELGKKRDGLTNPTTATVEQWVSQYLQEEKVGWKPRTHRNYSSVAKNHVYPSIGNVKLSKLKAVHIHNIYRKLEADSKHGTAAKVLCLLKPALRRAKRLGMIASNPADDVDGPATKRAAAKTWTPDEAETFLQAIKENRDYALYVTAIYCGLRIGELCALRWEHVRLDEAELDVKMTIGDSSSTHGTPKTESSERTITLPTAVVDALHERRKQNLTEGNAGSPWVFCAARGGNTWPTVVRAGKNKLMTDAGVPIIKLHEMRHFMPTSMLATDANPKVVSQQMGHSSVKITLDTYSHVDKSHQRQVSNAMDTLMMGVRSQRKSS